MGLTEGPIHSIRAEFEFEFVGLNVGSRWGEATSAARASTHRVRAHTQPRTLAINCIAQARPLRENLVPGPPHKNVVRDALW